jgi:hypothetical protein
VFSKGLGTKHLEAVWRRVRRICHPDKCDSFFELFEAPLQPITEMGGSREDVAKLMFTTLDALKDQYNKESPEAISGKQQWWNGENRKDAFFRQWAADFEKNFTDIDPEFEERTNQDYGIDPDGNDLGLSDEVSRALPPIFPILPMFVELLFHIFHRSCCPVRTSPTTGKMMT